MKQIEPKELTGCAPLLCQRCGAVVRFIGSEPHPVEDDTELLTYCCTGCDKFFVQPIKDAANDA